jgi:hypothetical protein
MTADPMEVLLARLLGNPTEVERFLNDRERYAQECGVSGDKLMDVAKIDAVSLQFAALSFQRKRRSVIAPERTPAWHRLLSKKIVETK